MWTTTRARPRARAPHRVCVLLLPHLVGGIAARPRPRARHRQSPPHPSHPIAATIVATATALTEI
eukprot:3562007-Pleurochrysis_carterae.AAC.1